MIAACLLTCGDDRHAEAARAAHSFARFNAGRDDVVRLHVDGGGPGRIVNAGIAARHGFATVWSPIARVGQIESFRFFFEAVDDFEFMVWLENDWESAAPLPSIDFLRKFHGVDQFRLYGSRKMRGDGPRAPAGTHLIGTKIPIDWKPSPDPAWECAWAHWGAGGTIVRPRVLAPYVDRPRLKDVIVATQLRTLRPRENILWHIGEKTTGGFFG